MTNSPTHVLKLRQRTNPANSRVVGSAWLNEDHGGYFSISLSIGTVLSWRDMEDCQLAIFPHTKPEMPKSGKKRHFLDNDEEEPF